MKKSRVDADIEVSAFEAPKNADRALDKANKTPHRLLEEFHLSLRQTPKPQNSTASGTSESTLICLRGVEEDVKDEDVFASTTMTASVRMLFSQATDLRNEGYTGFPADVKDRLPQRT